MRFESSEARIFDGGGVTRFRGCRRGSVMPCGLAVDFLVLHLAKRGGLCNTRPSIDVWYMEHSGEIDMCFCQLGIDWQSALLLGLLKIQYSRDVVDDTMIDRPAFKTSTPALEVADCRESDHACIYQSDDRKGMLSNEKS